MGRPSKSTKIIKMEGKSHRTKRELVFREEEEKALLTGIPLKSSFEVKQNPAALKKFREIKKIFAAIEKDDNLYGETVNRYCLLHAECLEQYEIKSELKEKIQSTDDIKEMGILMKLFDDADNKLQQKRKMMFDFEKENSMTIASSLRSIQKNPSPKKSKLMEALSGD